MSQQTQTTLDIEKIIATRQDPAASSAAAPSSLDYGEIAVDISGVLRTGNKNGQVVTHVISTDSRLTDTRNPRATNLTNENLNDIKTPGFYYAGGGNTVANKPSGMAAFGLLVEKIAQGYYSQIITGADSLPNKMFIRQFNASAWGAWQSFYTTAYKPTPAEIGAATASHTHSYLPLSGGTMTGSLKLKGDPTESLEAATKAYVDRQIGESGSGDMRKAVYDTDNDGIVDSSEKVESDGKKTSTTDSTTIDSAANEIPKTGISMYEFYNTTNSPITYANVINVRGRQAGGAGQLALGWEGSSTTPNIFYRAHRGQGNVAWGPWEKIVYESDLPSIKKTITVTGDSDKYYPVRISSYTNAKKGINPAFFGIFRNYAQKGPDDWNSATHRGALQFISKIFVNGWSGENSFMEWELAERYAVTFGGIQHSTRGNNFVVWLRGGGAEYDLMGENTSLNATIYYETTDLTTDLGFSVSPKTYDQIAEDYPKFDKGGSAHWKYDGTGVQRNYLANVDLGGTPKAVTPSTSDNSTRIATTAYVKNNLLTDGISTYTHSKSGTVHTLTGSGDNIRFVATADFTSGDTFKIGTSDVTAKTIGGDSLWTGFFKNGAVVTCYKNGTTINFNGGGLPASELAKLTPENIKSGIKITANGKTVTGTFTNDGTATQDDILLGQTAYVAGVKLTGRIPKAPSSTPATGSGDSGGQFYLTTQEGFYAEGTKLTKPSEEMGAAIGLTAGVLKTGTTIGGVRGTYTSDANAAASNILSGKTAYVNGSKITGSMADRTAVGKNGGIGINSSYPSVPVFVGTSPQTGKALDGNTYAAIGVPSGFYNGGGYVGVNVNTVNLKAENIKSGVTIFGISGTYNGASGGYLYMGQRNNTQMYGYAFGTATYSNGVRIGTSGNYRLVMFGYNETGATGRMKVNGSDVFAYDLNPATVHMTTKYLSAGNVVTITADSGVNYALTGFVYSI